MRAELVNVAGAARCELPQTGISALRTYISEAFVRTEVRLYSKVGRSGATVMVAR
jgi:hypothetical protein